MPERLVPRLKSTIEGLPDRRQPTRDLGELFMVMYLKRSQCLPWHRFDPSTPARSNIFLARFWLRCYGNGSGRRVVEPPEPPSRPTSSPPPPLPGSMSCHRRVLQWGSGLLSLGFQGFAKFGGGNLQTLMVLKFTRYPE